MDHFTFVVKKNRGMGLLACLFMKKNLLKLNPPSSKKIMVSQTRKKNFNGQSWNVVDIKINGKNVVIFSLSLSYSLSDWIKGGNWNKKIKKLVILWSYDSFVKHNVENLIVVEIDLKYSHELLTQVF